MEYRVIPLEVEHAEAICSWRYEPPYDLYNWDSWEKMQREGEEFADPVIRRDQYAAVVNEEHALVGFCQFFPLKGVTRLGLGMSPDRCGHGFGQRFVSAIVKEARRRAPKDEIDLEVLTWNDRAIRTYEKAGFERTDTYRRMTPSGMAQFHCMVYRQR